jgi:hypothetical protein
MPKNRQKMTRTRCLKSIFHFGALPFYCMLHASNAAAQNERSSPAFPSSNHPSRYSGGPQSENPEFRRRKVRNCTSSRYQQSDSLPRFIDVLSASMRYACRARATAPAMFLSTPKDRFAIRPSKDGTFKQWLKKAEPWALLSLQKTPCKQDQLKRCDACQG